MIKEEILAMSGNKLKAEVAQRIMGIKVEYPFAEGYPYYLREDKDGKMKWDIVPDYPGDISAAWQVVEKMRENITEGEKFTDEWWAFVRGFGEFYIEQLMRIINPETICKAALLAKLEGEGR